MDNRQAALQSWVVERCDALGIDLAPDWELRMVSGDASFRRYFRVSSHNLTWIAVDAPPARENSHAFVSIARAWEPLQIQAPVVYDVDLAAGFMLLSDLGDRLYLGALCEANVDELYAQALLTLTHIQQCKSILGEPLPPYDRRLLEAEMGLFGEWFLGRLLNLALSDKELHLLEACRERLVVSALQQPQVCVHRDYHSRNLMVTAEPAPGVLDFQDAVWGPVTYDLVSLLRDCYIAWPAQRVRGWALDYARLAESAGILDPVTDEQWLRWFDLMGMQRHLKAIGIFARLKLRDDKAGYLPDIPRTLGYLVQVAEHYAEFAAFAALLRERVIPAMKDSGLFSASALAAL